MNCQKTLTEKKGERKPWAECLNWSATTPPLCTQRARPELNWTRCKFFLFWFVCASSCVHSPLSTVWFQHLVYRARTLWKSAREGHKKRKFGERKRKQEPGGEREEEKRVRIRKMEANSKWEINVRVLAPVQWTNSHSTLRGEKKDFPNYKATYR